MRPPLSGVCTALALAGLLAACATPAPEAPGATTTAQGQPKPKKTEEDRETITGSRLPAKSTDRTVHRVGAAGAREMDRERGPDPGPLNR